MELWNKITGTITVELTGADIEGLLGILTASGISVWDVKRSSGLVMVLRIRRAALSQVQQIAEKNGAALRLLGLSGAYYAVKSWRKRPLMIVTAISLLLASLYLPNRILFVNVVGNESVPTRLIQETAAQFGLEFGASRRQVRSERIKNELLGAIDELEWVGVNTSGSTAIITVRERQPEPQEEREKICNLVACADGIVESITLTRGTVLCQPGQAVREGQILVSAYSDLGICTRAVEAEAEVYARTLHQKKAVLPENTLRRVSQRDKWTKCSIIIGKKRINLYSDSGILPSTCGKMSEVMPLRLPGGLTLPVALVVERYTEYETAEAPRGEPDTVLEDASRRQLQSAMVAGQILTEESELMQQNGRWELASRFECREMIARQEVGVNLEGDTEDDPEDSERGAS